jgi:hypothetical protein
LGAAPPSCCGGALPGTRARRGVSRAPSARCWTSAARWPTRTSPAAPVLPIPACGRYPSVRSATMSAVAVSKHSQSICPQHSMCGTGELQREASCDPCSAPRPGWVLGVGEYPRRTPGEEMLCKRLGNRQATPLRGSPQTSHRRWLLPLPFARRQPRKCRRGEKVQTFPLSR